MAHAAAGLVKVVDAVRLPGTVHSAHEARRALR
jgi:hypothetical protein